MVVWLIFSLLPNTYTHTYRKWKRIVCVWRHGNKICSICAGEAIRWRRGNGRKQYSINKLTKAVKQIRHQHQRQEQQQDAGKITLNYVWERLQQPTLITYFHG